MDIGGPKMAGFASGVIDSFQYLWNGDRPSHHRAID